MDFLMNLVHITKGQTGVNPPVAAVILKSGRIVGFGAHLKQGGAHAEIEAIKMAGENCQDATMYVTLEPCSHHGKTPPCVDQIIDAKIKRVVYAVKDVTLNSGVNKLKAHGVEVEHVPHETLTEFYDTFFKSKHSQLPITTVKVSSTLDGKVANDFKESKWITNKSVKLDVFKLRHAHDAIITGYGTIQEDNPELTTRIPDAKDPTPIILSRKGNIDFSLKIFNQQNREVIIFTENDNLRAPNSNIKLIHLENCDVETILNRLYILGFGRVLIEAGPNVSSQFLNSNVITNFILYLAPKLIGGSGKYQFFKTDDVFPLHSLPNFSCVHTEHIDDNLKLIFKKEI
ncbi:bifunctional diaminohydroxyphosphoribosylaminopyrimidine deaminase/5-amino-6-(5-phosphoribosylamino)uracil reductase RibD [Nosocomiicoccus ampullae]|nr:bifunctional diaminohydroxyphosphoribosylaminopyrimidine deaminase/5-amino-6-(5-phosphoribosylamino)uracil reductase RibD [Nosocomiicoccus ampullae]QYA47610.1 bifunctional diaminohydroxyphosphoribosylaminopyrimidine deaminase/5-amino-6-(5-phosphoribosylamino)uracil reductase RibD [Nosocomiicoccus ampullae]